LDRSTANSLADPVHRFTRMTSPGFFAAILEPDTYPPRNMAHPASPVYRETAAPIFSRPEFVLCLTSARDPTRGARGLAKLF